MSSIFEKKSKNGEKQVLDPHESEVGVGVRPESATHGLYLTQVIADDGKNYFQASLGVLE